MYKEMVFIDKYITNNMIFYDYPSFQKLCLFLMIVFLTDINWVQRKWGLSLQGKGEYFHKKELIVFCSF